MIALIRRLAQRLARCLALWLAMVAASLLPPEQREWGRAMRGEVAAIAAPGAALGLALGCLHHGLSGWIARHPLWLGTCCAVLATACGLAFMALAGAPLRYLAINAAALAIGLLALANLRLVLRLFPRGEAWLPLGLGLLLVVLTPFGIAAQGAARWVALGGVLIQPSLIAVPLLLVLAARRSNLLAATGVGLAALALAWQPDRAMAGALALAALGLWPGAVLRLRLAVILPALAGFLITLARPDLGERMPYVDQILWLAYGLHPLAGLAVWAGTLLLLAPAVVLWRLRADLRPGLMVQGLFWTGAVLAAALGNYPTPLVGFGSSAVIGYCLSLLALTERRGQREQAGLQRSNRNHGPLIPPGLEMTLR